jgi:hypothetical protein
MKRQAISILSLLQRLLLMTVLAALVAAAWGGLARLGWQLAPFQVVEHGPLMIGGVLGTVICLERAVALAASLKRGKFLPYTAPLLSGLGTLLLLTGLAGRGGAALITLGSFALVILFAIIVRRQSALFTWTMLLGAAAWLVGNVLWFAGWSIFQLVHWWVGFLVLTIAGERLELARMIRLTPEIRLSFGAAAALLIVAMIVKTLAFDAGAWLFGVGEIALALWLLSFDIAGRTVRQQGLPRFVAICLLLGYFWLGIGGMLGIALGGLMAGAGYDAVLHSVLLGFAVSMIFGHAPIILPALTGMPVPYRSWFYSHLLTLHVALVVRIAGDLTGSLAARQWGGMFNVVALTLFLANTAAAVLSQRRTNPVQRAK